ncbi:MAG: lysozyme, partial [Litorimonas sp.]
MRRNMQISKVGLKLIKAYEGYRPVDRHLVNGQHVVGYGHIIEGDDSLVLTRPEAEDLLLRDLEPYEDMVNETVHAPLSQSQYDALVSLAFNIGPRAFTQSDTLRALNNGRPLDAASGFDVWRKSKIDGKTYVVDALMRRRSAEKALFLRKESGKILPASRADLPPVKDEMVELLSTEDALPVISNTPINGLVKRVPYDANDLLQDTEGRQITPVALAVSDIQITQSDEDGPLRRREDGPSGVLELSDIYEGDDATADSLDIKDDLVDATYEVDDFDYGDDEVQPETITTEVANSPSQIAKTASKISDRLDALIDDVANDDLSRDAENWPTSLIQAQGQQDYSQTDSGQALPNDTMGV